MKPVKKKKIKSESKLSYISDKGKFNSKAEADRYSVLLELEKKGKISNLEKHIQFTLLDAHYVTKKEKIVMKTKTKYVKKKVCDEYAVTLDVSFVYLNHKGRMRVEVVKTDKDYKEPVYVLKRKLMRYLHNIVIIEN